MTHKKGLILNYFIIFVICSISFLFIASWLWFMTGNSYLDNYFTGSSSNASLALILGSAASMVVAILFDRETNYFISWKKAIYLVPVIIIITGLFFGLVTDYLIKTPLKKYSMDYFSQVVLPFVMISIPTSIGLAFFYRLLLFKLNKIKK